MICINMTPYKAINSNRVLAKKLAIEIRTLKELQAINTLQKLGISGTIKITKK